MDQIFDEQNLSTATPDEGAEVGELAIDVYQTEDSVVIKAPMAGVDPQDLELAVQEEMITIKGKRHAEHEVKKDEYLLQECFWGAFERSFSLPVPVESEKARAQLKNGLLTITIPKAKQEKTKFITVETE